MNRRAVVSGAVLAMVAMVAIGWTTKESRGRGVQYGPRVTANNTLLIGSGAGLSSGIRSFSFATEGGPTSIRIGSGSLANGVDTLVIQAGHTFSDRYESPIDSARVITIGTSVVAASGG